MKFSQVNLILDITIFLLAILIDFLWIRWNKKHSTSRHPKRRGMLLLFNKVVPEKTTLDELNPAGPPQSKTTPVIISIYNRLTSKIIENTLIMWGKLRDRILRWWENGHHIFSPTNSANHIAPGLKKWQALIEVGVIVIIVWTYCWGFLDLGKHTVLPGNEAEMYPNLDLIFTNTLHQSGHLLSWNPYYLSGLPLIGDPMFHFFNPLASLPILLFGVADGFKVAVFLSFIAGAVGMWFMALTFGIKPVTRVWMALLFAFAGQPTARFFQGEYLFVFAWAFIPWVIGGLYAVYRTRRRIFAAITAFALGELFLSGNAYYAFYAIFIVLLFLFVYLFSLSWKKPILRFDSGYIVIYGVIGLVTIGLIAVQLLPTYQLWPRVSKAEDIVGSANLGQVIMDFLSNDSLRPDMYPLFPAREEFYAYIGITPFLFLLLLPLALFKRNKRNIFFAFLIIVFTFLWMDVKDMPWVQLYLSTHVLAQFRHQVRIIIYTEIALLILMGYSFDTAWQALWRHATEKQTVTRIQGKRIASIVGAGFLLGLAGYSVFNVYTTNRPITFTTPIYDPPYQALSWLDKYDQSIYFTRYNPSNSGYNATITNHMRLLEIPYHFYDIRLSSTGQNQRTIQAHPNYTVQSPVDTPPENSKVIKTFSDYTIYYSPDALPFSFSVSNQTLADPSDEELKRQDVIPQTTYSPNGDYMEVVADGSSDSTLVTLVTNFPGWIARIDGQPVQLNTVNGYLAVSMRNGVHQYSFTFESGALYTGIIISLLSLLVVLYWLLRDLNWVKAWAGVRELISPGKLNWKARIRNNPITAFFQRIINWQVMEVNILGLNIQIKRNSKQVKRVVSFGTTLFIASLIVYAVIHFVGIKQYPIYFFADEATPSLYAENLIKNHFVDGSGNLFPVYFEVDANRWTPLLSVYPEGIGTLLFGKSVSTTRGTSAAISFLAAISLAFMLKRVFKVRYWWIGVLILGLIPAWFLHSRTAFETAMMCSFYAVFLLFYLLYLSESPKYILPATLFAGLTFYTYSNGQMIIGLTFVFLLISDFRYHLKNWRINLWVLLLGLVILFPLIRFTIQHPSGFSKHLETLGSYWFSDASISQKILTFLQKYTYGLSPQYWFINNGQDHIRHTMDGFGSIWLGMLPFFLIGLVAFIWHLRVPKYRAILLAILAIPVSSALVDIGITRVLAFVIPAALLISIGCNWFLELLSKRFSPTWIALITFTFLTFGSINMLQTALTQGPHWDTDYGFYGMQWGATQLYEDTIPKYLAMDPKNKIQITSTWANASDRFIPFFLSEKDQQRVSIVSFEDYSITKRDLNSNLIFISTPDEYKTVKQSNKFDKIFVREIIRYPDGTPGFYVLQASYRSDVDQIFTVEKEARKKLVTENYNLNGQNLVVSYSMVNTGEIKNLFDNDQSTLIRGLEANPFIIEIEFPRPQSISEITLATNTINIRVTTFLYPPNGQNAKKFESELQYDDSTGVPAKIEFAGSPYLTKKLRVEILSTSVAPDVQTNIHVRDLHWK
jgi:hypothetical protein